MKARTIAGTLALIFALVWFAQVELRLLGLPTRALSHVMDRISKSKSDVASPVFTLNEVYDQIRGLALYLERQTPTTIPGVAAAIIGFELLRRGRSRPKDDR